MSVSGFCKNLTNKKCQKEHASKTCNHTRSSNWFRLVSILKKASPHSVSTIFTLNLLKKHSTFKCQWFINLRSGVDGLSLSLTDNQYCHKCPLQLPLNLLYNEILVKSRKGRKKGEYQQKLYTWKEMQWHLNERQNTSIQKCCNTFWAWFNIIWYTSTHTYTPSLMMQHLII